MLVPGESAHYIMAPELRKEELDKIKVEERNSRHAAVLMLLYPKNNEAYLSLILRPTYEGVHSGQIALPGGKVEEIDENYRATALREAWEEVGVPPDSVAIIKELTQVYIPPSNFWVHPYLGYTKDIPDFVRQEEEVEKIIEVPIRKLLDETSVVSRNLSTSYAKNIEVPSFKLNDYTVWGATAMMLSELKILLKSTLDTRFCIFGTLFLFNI